MTVIVKEISEQSDTSSVWDNQPKTPTRDTVIEIDVVAKRCVYINNHRVAGGKPWAAENLPSHTLKTTLGEVLDAFSEAQIRKALLEKNVKRDYFAVYHAAKKAGDSA